METVMDVTVEELCTSDVARIPMNKPTNGFDVMRSSCSATPCPINLNDSPISSMLVKKSVNTPRRARTCNAVLWKGTDDDGFAEGSVWGSIELQGEWIAEYRSR
jgi:hypothetical protein